MDDTPIGKLRLEWDGFISRRDDGVDASHDLKALLLNRRIKAAHQEDCPKLGKLSHTTAEAQLINATNFAIVLFSPRFLQGSRHQKKEIESILMVHATREGGKPYEIFPAILAEGRAGDAIQRWQDQMENDYPQLLEKGEVVVIEEFNNIQSDLREEKLNELADKVSQYFSTRRVPKVLQGKKAIEDFNQRYSRTKLDLTPAPPPPQPPAADDLDADLSAYLQRSVEGWTRGRVGGAANFSDEALPFQFDPSRYCDLYAAVRGAAVDADTPATVPVSELILTDPSPLIALTGPVGSGKTTTLAALAAACAAGRERRYGVQSRVLGSEWVARVSQLASETFPILIRCADVAARLRDGASGSAAIVDAIASEVFGEVTKQRVKQLNTYLSGQRTLLLLDALDEAGDRSVSQAISGAAADLVRATNSKADAPLRIVISRRPETRISEGFRVVDLRGFLVEQVDQFVDAFVKSMEAVDDDALPIRVNDEVAALQKDDRHADLLTSPLILNAICWLVGEGESFSGNRSKLLAQVVQHLIRSRDVRYGDAVLPPKDVLALLSVLAWQALHGEGDDEQNVGAISEAQALACARKAANCSESAAKELLSNIVFKTNILRRRAVAGKKATYTSYQFAPVVLCEYLAGEYLRNVGCESAIQDVPAAKVARLTPSLGYAFAREAAESSEGPDAAVTLASALVAKAELSSREALPWIRAALTMLAESDSLYIGTSSAPFSSLTPAIESLIQLSLNARQHWTLRERAEVWSAILKLQRLSSPGCSRVASAWLLGRALKSGTQDGWISAPAAGSSYKLASIPVLVGEYEAFLDSDTGDTWAHAPPEEQNQTIATAAEATGDSHATPEDVWGMQWPHPGTPVVYVTWYEAVAYALWYEKRERAAGRLAENETIRLPTAREALLLSKAFANGKRFPWGADKMTNGDAARVGWRGAGLDRPAPPGVFEPYGLDGLYDWGSNVRVWTIPERKDRLWPPRLPYSDEKVEYQQVAGGSWIDPEREFSVSDDVDDFGAEYPGARSWRIGLRLVRTDRTSGTAFKISKGS